MSAVLTNSNNAVPTDVSGNHQGSPTTAPSSRRFRPDIQGLRAIAVTMVVFYHAGVPWLGGGFVGVDVFFVISGFLITGHLIREVEQTGGIRIGRFYAARARRLLPTAALVIVATLLAARLWGSVFQVRSIASDAMASALYAMNYRLALAGVQYSNAGSAESPFKHFWSLAVEEQFYVAWPVVIVVIAWLARRRFTPVLVLALLAVIAGSLWTSEHLLTASGPMGYYSLQSRAWELAAGALLAVAAPHLTRLPQVLATTLAWVGVVGIVAAGLVYSDQTRFPGVSATWPVAATLLVIGAGCSAPHSGVEWLLGRRLFQGIGKVSYAWYLWHWPVFILVPQMAGRSLSTLEMAELVVVSLWMSVLSYWIVENTTLRGVQLKVRAWAVAGLGLMAASTAAAIAISVSVPSLVGSGTAVQAAPLNSADVSALQAAISAGTRLEQVPVNLQPTVQEALTDSPISTMNGCHAGFLQVAQGDCIFGDPQGTRTLVLFGDSHAQQWLPALDVSARKLGWRVVSWTKAACSVVDILLWSPELHREYTECVLWREQTKGRIEQLQPDVVVVGQSDTVPGDVSNTLWADASASLVQEFSRELAVPTFYMLDTPAPSGSVPDCVAGHLEDIGACVVKREDATPWDNRQQQVAETLAAAGAHAINPFDWFCGASDCPAVVGNILVYRDGSHMSATYSEYLAPMTEQLFVERLG
ncbi:acyltransferase family protein [Kineococcus sp. SYSU DK018]|uniref:acyltransferase family protein n=1 Tax=Kineococcus sp. SYSU DK018 TaxID=3383139 RepID=UPI003D7DA78A